VRMLYAVSFVYATLCFALCQPISSDPHSSITNNPAPLPPPSSEVDDDVLLANEPWVESPFYADYGYNIHIGEQVYINFNCTILDSCAVRIGSRTLIGPNVSLYTATHPVDPAVRNGLKGPEMGKEICIGEDCWIGGSVVVL
jgi:acetyltransferase-like isoleucine patch superfamily enzyme